VDRAERGALFTRHLLLTLRFSAAPLAVVCAVLRLFCPYHPVSWVSAARSRFPGFHEESSTPHEPSAGDPENTTVAQDT
jgi:hypothetical protein